MSQNRSKHKIGILAECSFLPVSDDVKRALKIAEKALIDLGYEVVHVKYEDDLWRQSLDSFASIIGNGAGKAIMRDFEKNAEPVIPSVKSNFTLLKMGPIRRYFLLKLLGFLGY